MFIAILLITAQIYKWSKYSSTNNRQLQREANGAQESSSALRWDRISDPGHHCLNAFQYEEKKSSQKSHTIWGHGLTGWITCCTCGNPGLVLALCEPLSMHKQTITRCYTGSNS